MLLLFFGDELCKFVLEEPSLFQVYLFLTDYLSVLIVNGPVAHSTVVDRLFQFAPFDFLSLTIGLENKHLFVS